MLILIKNAEIFSPVPLGVLDVLICGDTIQRLDQSIELDGEDVEIVDAAGQWLMPGFVDALTHPCGGGGEGGFGNRTGEISAEAFIRAGVTTPVGALGTDSVARSHDVLYGSVMSLRANGLSAFMYSGAYRVPAPTLTGDLARDLVLVEPVIGVGEVAIADHRGAQPSVDEFTRMAADVALGGILSGKKGTVFVHVGAGDSGLDLIEQVLESSDLQRSLFYPTHVNRSHELLSQAVNFTKKGGFADITVSTTPELIEAGDLDALQAWRDAVAAGAPPDKLTFSSDAGGSLPLFKDGEVVGLQAAEPSVMLQMIRDASTQEEVPVFEVIAAMTANPARALGLKQKGQVAKGLDADVLLFDPGKGKLTGVYCLGRRLL